MKQRPFDLRWLTAAVGIFFLLLLLPALACRAAEPLTLKIEGVEDAPLENVRAALSWPPGLFSNGKLNRAWLERFRRQIPAKVGIALEPFGYYQSEATTELSEDSDGIPKTLTVRVNPGDPVRISRLRVTVEGEGEAALDKVVREFPLAPGDVLRHDLYEEGKGAIKSRAIDLGYLDADFSSKEIRVNREEKKAEIDLVLVTGPRYYFGEVFVHGASDYPDPFLRRYLSFQTGDPFSFGELGQTQVNYFDSDRFKEVLITPRKDLARDQQVPVAVQLTPSPSKRLKPGIGYATDTGARFTLNYQDVNIFDSGHEFEAKLSVAELQQAIGAGYIRPRPRDKISHTAFKAGYDRQDLDTYETESLFLEVEEVRAFGRGQLGSIYLRLLQEDYSIAGEDSRSTLVLPGVRFSQRRYPDVVRPKKGYRFEIEARGTNQLLGSDTSLSQIIANLNFLLPLPWDFLLLARGGGGITLQSDPLKEIPPSLRFFAGGDQSVRGYPYQSLGPENDAGEVVGGKNLLTGSLELERSLSEKWGVAVFYDLGNAFDSFGNMDLQHAAGLGARRYTPIGPIKIDLARQLYVADPSMRLHVSVGFGW